MGDSPYDVAAAKASGWGFYGVTTGTHTEDELRKTGAENVFADLPAVAQAWARERAALG